MPAVSGHVIILAMELKIKAFEELTLNELYEILKARNAVFVVEQTCPYQDIDGIDPRSVHLFFEEEGNILACLRLFVKEEGVVQVGRVLTLKRGLGLGGRLLHEAVEYAAGPMKAERMYLEAQTYAVGFYEKEGFRVISEPFDEDGIPHVKMIRE
jgi:ElaA protein